VTVEFHALEQDAPLVMEFEHALDCLLRCSINRRESSSG
jgi:hypothetical protein